MIALPPSLLCLHNNASRTIMSYVHLIVNQIKQLSGAYLCCALKTKQRHEKKESKMLPCGTLRKQKMLFCIIKPSSLLKVCSSKVRYFIIILRKDCKTQKIRLEYKHICELIKIKYNGE